MRSFLIVFESKVKAENAKEMLISSGVENFNSIATEGRIFDLDEDSISLDNNLDIIEKPLNTFIIKRIEEEAKKYTELIIATDLDPEGEKIASDILKISKKKSYKRINPENFNDKNWENAISKVYKIDENEVKAQSAKRMFDRIIGFQTESKFQEQIGRVLSPVLAEVESGGFPTSIFEVELENNKKLILKGSQTNDAENSSIEEVLSTISDIDLIEDETKSHDENITFWTGEQAIINASIALDMPVVDVFDSMQRLYEGGMISYFRTDRCRIEISEAKELAEMASEWGVNIDDLDVIAAKSEAKNELLSKTRMVHGGHGALIPKKLSINPFGNINEMTRDEKVLALITRHSLRCMKKPGKIKEKSFKIPKTASNRKLNMLIDKFNLSANVVSRTIKNSNDLVEKPYYPEIYIEDVNFRRKNKNRKVSSFSIPKDIAVSMIMYRAGLGRPSTMAYHSDKISSRMMNSSCQLNGVGLSNLEYAKQNYPKMSSKDTYSKLDTVFHDVSLSTKERVASALKIAGIIKDDIKDEFLKISHDIADEMQSIIDSGNEFVERDKENARIKEKERMKEILVREEKRISMDRNKGKSKEKLPKRVNTDHSDLDM